MTETREPYKTFADEPCAPLFMVELIDSKGKSHGYIGYRFHAPGAQAACDGWNNQRERFDLVAVIKPVVEPTVIEEPKPTEPAALPEGYDFADGSTYASRMEHHQIVKARVGDYIALNEIAALLSIGAAAREDRELIVENVRNLVAAIKNPDRYAWRQLRESASSPSPAISHLRSHKQMLIKSLKACMRAMDDGRPADPSCKRWDRARELADEVIVKVD